jgi:hypothetical protein
MSLEEVVSDLVKAANEPLRRFICDKAKYAYMQKAKPEYEPEDITINEVEVRGDLVNIYFHSIQDSFHWGFDKDELFGIVLTYLLGGELDDAFYNEKRWVDEYYTAGCRDDDKLDNGQPVYTAAELKQLTRPAPRPVRPTMTERQIGSAERVKYRSFCWQFRAMPDPWFNLGGFATPGGPDNTKCKEAASTRAWVYDEERKVHYCPGCGLVVTVSPLVPDITDDIPE